MLKENGFRCSKQANMSEVLYPKESYKIVGAVYEVHKHLGPGLLEKVYQEALEQEFLLQGIPFEREKEYEVVYKGKILDKNILQILFAMIKSSSN